MDNGKLNISITHNDVHLEVYHPHVGGKFQLHNIITEANRMFAVLEFPLELPMLVEKGERGETGPRGHDGRVGPQGPPGPKWYPEDEG